VTPILDAATCTAGGEHVAQKFDGIVSRAREFVTSSRTDASGWPVFAVRQRARGCRGTAIVHEVVRLAVSWSSSFVGAVNSRAVMLRAMPATGMMVYRRRRIVNRETRRSRLITRESIRIVRNLRFAEFPGVRRRTNRVLARTICRDPATFRGERWDADGYRRMSRHS